MQPDLGHFYCVMVRIHEILDKAAGYMAGPSRALIQKAYIFSATAHAGQTRRSGEPYLFHPLEVADILTDMKMDAEAVAAGLLHDTVEDTKTTIEDLDAEFGEDVADIVDGVTKLSQFSFETKEQAQAESIRKMILAMAENMSVLIVKLADRLHNMRTLGYMPLDKQQCVSRETMDIYAPLANRLGLHRIKIELEDLSLKHLKPDVYAQINEGLYRHQVADQDYIKKVIDIADQMLAENNVKGRVCGRCKNITSIYAKMVQHQFSLAQIFDLVAFRIIVTRIRDCYSVLGLVHAAWRPVPGRFKDYISLPKANMYQSLHTTVMGPGGQRIEIQIRTEEMNQFAEYGVAAHWLYKDNGKLKPKEVQELSWFRQLLDWQKEESDSREFMRSLRCDLFKKECYVFTPKGQVKELPEGATPIDFAYLIHTHVGDRCAGAKVNGRLVPLATELKNGDMVEVVIDPHRNPSRDWLKFVKTAKARTRINHYIQTEERIRSIALAKEMLEKEGRRLGVSVSKALKENLFESLAREFSYKSADDLFSALGYGRLTPRKVLRRLLPKDECEARDVWDNRDGREEVIGKRLEEKGKAGGLEESASQKVEGVSIKGVDNVLMRFAGCCNPLPGDIIIGYISRARGVTVHTVDCPNVNAMEPERLIAVSWGSKEDKPYPVKVRITCRNELGVLAEIGTLLALEQVNIDAGSFRSTVDGNTEILFTVEVRDTVALYQTIDKLNQLSAIIGAVRLSAGAV
ncbi:GTP pyrophosphokinase [Desulfovibrionales bacterium]